MKRFGGEELGPEPRIALITNDSLGNYIAASPLLQMLRAKYGRTTLDYYGGERTEELWSKESLIDAGFAALGSRFQEEARASLSREPYDLVINLEQGPWARTLATLLSSDQTRVVGPALSPDGRAAFPFEPGPRGDLWQDQEWIAPGLTSRYPFLNSGFISEIFCRLSYLDGPIPSYRVPVEDPGSDVPEVLVSASASLSEKLWPVQKWLAVMEVLQCKGDRVGVVGAPPGEQSRFWDGTETEERLVGEAGAMDLRGQFTLPQVAGAIARAKLVLTIDNGILHLAAAVGTRTVGLFRPGIVRLWAPPSECLTALAPGEDGKVVDIQVSQVISAFGS